MQNRKRLSAAAFIGLWFVWPLHEICAKNLTPVGVNYLIAKQFGFELPDIVLDDYDTPYSLAAEAVTLVPRFIAYGPTNAARYHHVFCRPSNSNFDLHGNFIGPVTGKKWFSSKPRTRESSSLYQKLSKARFGLDFARNFIRAQEINGVPYTGLSPLQQDTIDILTSAIITLKHRTGNCAEHSKLAAAWMYYNLKDTRDWEVFTVGMGRVFWKDENTTYRVYPSSDGEKFLAIENSPLEPAPSEVSLVIVSQEGEWIKFEGKAVTYDHLFTVVKGGEEIAICDPWALSGIHGTAISMKKNDQDISSLNDALRNKQWHSIAFQQKIQNNPQFKRVITWVRNVWEGAMLAGMLAPDVPNFSFGRGDEDFIAKEKATVYVLRKPLLQMVYQGRLAFNSPVRQSDAIERIESHAELKAQISLRKVDLSAPLHERRAFFHELGVLIPYAPHKPSETFEEKMTEESNEIVIELE